ncbi:MAG: YggS family pyridoxal phosphate-dependent enzyme [Bacillota bacterium]
MTLEARYHKLKEEIQAACDKANRDVSEITLIAVTKYVTIDETKHVHALGVHDLGENRVKETEEKIAAIEDVTWHFIGPLQSRKVKEIAEQIDCFHALDRLKIAKELNKRRSSPLDCFIQVNISGEATKGGVEKTDVQAFVESLADLEHIRVIGLMTMAPHSGDEALVRGVFKELRMCRDRIQALGLPHAPCDYLSMGMSNDFEWAILEGATHLRIGSTLVNPEG